MSGPEVVDAVAALKQRHRATWAAGDFPTIAKLTAPVGEAIVERAGVGAGMEVLDVATGDGNVAIPAALAGARVVGLDLTPELFESARARAQAAGVEVEWVEGDAEQLPFADESFDRVLSNFGVMFAPRHAVAAAELARVCKPGGAIGLCTWTPAGWAGQLFKTLAGYVPAAPEFAQPPALWGDESHVRGLFADTGVELEFATAVIEFEFESLDNAVSLFQRTFGPIVLLEDALREAGRWDDMLADLRRLFEDTNAASDGSATIPAEYLVTIGRKAA